MCVTKLGKKKKWKKKQRKGDMRVIKHDIGGLKLLCLPGCLPFLLIHALVNYLKSLKGVEGGGKLPLNCPTLQLNAGVEHLENRLTAA